MKVKNIVSLLAIAGMASPALATDGYFSDGYGIKAKGMAGVAIALPQDALAAANNPAGMVMVGSRLDVGLDWFRPTRGADVVGNQAGLSGSYNGNDKQNFFIPEFGYNRMLGSDMSVGVSVYGNGGMNTRYKTSPFAAWGVTGPTGINLEQLFIAPTFAMKVNERNAFGVSAVFSQQRFGATGLQPFANAQTSSNPANVTDRGNDTTTGWGARLGWTGQVSDSVTLGATYASKIKGKFSNYSGLFADQGKFDIPENYGLGIAVKATSQLTVAADVKQINYDKIHSVGNPINSLLSGVPLGASNGPGFGYQDVTVYKLGVSYDYSKDLALRAGYAYNKQPIPASQTFFNILAPAVEETHLTFGATWTLANKDELSLAYMHAFNKTVTGANSIAPSMGGGNANLHMYEDSLGIAYGIKFK